MECGVGEVGRSPLEELTDVNNKYIIYFRYTINSREAGINIVSFHFFQSVRGVLNSMGFFLFIGVLQRFVANEVKIGLPLLEMRLYHY